MKHTRSLWAALLLTTGAATSLGAQLQEPPPPSEMIGVRTVLSLGYLRPFLGGGGERVFGREGRFEAAEALQVGLGYDRARYGGTVALEIASPGLGERQASALSLAALAHWYPDLRVLRQWQPVFTAGYVRHGLGGLDMYSEHLPTFVIDTDAAGIPPRIVENVGLLGNGLRAGVGARRKVFGAGALVLEATGDLVSFSAFSSDGSEDSVPAPGSSFIPRLAVGLTFWPF